MTGADDAAFAELLRRLADGTGHEPPVLDDGTAERLLAGGLDPADAPPGYAEVAAVLAAATAEPSPDELAGQAAAVAELAAATRARAAVRRPSRTAGRRRTGLAVAVVVGALSIGGVAAAATGHLPEPIREAARDVLTRAGVATADPPATQGRETPEAGTAAAGRGARPAGATGQERRRSDAAAPAGAGTKNGLCRAYLAGQGRKLSTAAFQALAAAAGGADKIAGFCEGTPPGGGSHRGDGHGQGGPPPGKGGGKQQNREPGPTNGRGRSG